MLYDQADQANIHLISDPKFCLCTCWKIFKQTIRPGSARMLLQPISWLLKYFFVMFQIVCLHFIATLIAGL